MASETLSTVYVTWDAYTDSRRRQDVHLSKEFSTLHESVDRVEGELNEFRDDVNKRFDEVDGRFDAVDRRLDGVDRRFDEVDRRFDAVDRRFDTLEGRFDTLEGRFDRMELEFLRLNARFQNYILKNPYLRIKPVVAYHPDRGIVEPDRALFPRHARDFYALRDPSNEHQRRVLAYLLSFYDVQLPGRHESSENSEDEGEGLAMSDPAMAVEVLEGILGLSEDNFIRFKERAQKHALEPSTTAGKRSHPTGGEQSRDRDRPRHEPQPAPWRPRSKSPSSKTSSLEEKAMLGWGNRSTPSSQRPTIMKLAARQQQAVPTRQDDPTAPSERGSPTNPNTSPRGSPTNVNTSPRGISDVGS